MGLDGTYRYSDLTSLRKSGYDSIAVQPNRG